MLYTDFQRKNLEENMIKIERFGKKLEPNLKKTLQLHAEKQYEFIHRSRFR